MSIIYDALQKTQRQLNTKNLSNSKLYPRNWFDILLLSIILTLVIITLIAYYPMMKKWFAKTPSANKLNVAPVPVQNPSVKLVLNGIFISDNEKVAQINNRMLSVGDTIGGNTIIEITPTRVKLLGNQGIFYIESESFP